MQTNYSLKIFAPLCIALLGACGYAVKINDNVVYTPAPLLSDFVIADVNLRKCIQQTIEDKKITDAKQLRLLNCSNAGIANLTGLESFSELEELNLANNLLETLAPLGKLTHLKVLVLRDNKLTSIAPLLQLMHLSLLDLEQNPRLGCGDIKQLVANQERTQAKIIEPQQCR